MPATKTSSKSNASKGKGKSKAASVDPDEPAPVPTVGRPSWRDVRDRRGRRSGSRRSAARDESELNARDGIEEDEAPSSSKCRPPTPGIADPGAESTAEQIRADYLHRLPYELWLVVFNHVRRVPSPTPLAGQGHAPDDDTQLAAAKHLVLQTLWDTHRTCRLFRTITHVFLATAVLDSCPYLPLLLDTNVIAKHRAAAASSSSLANSTDLQALVIPLILLQGPSPDPSSTPDSDTPPRCAASLRTHRLTWSKSMARHLRHLTHPTSRSLDDWSPALPTPPNLAKLPTLISSLIATSFSPVPPDKYTSDFTDWHAYPSTSTSSVPISATPALDSTIYDPNALHIEQLRDMFHREAGRRGKVVSRAWVEYAGRKDRIAREAARALVRLGAAFGWRWSARAREVLDLVLLVEERGGAASAAKKDEAEAGRMRSRRDKMWADMAAEEPGQEDEWVSGKKGKGKGKAARRAGRGSARRSEGASTSGASHHSASAPAASTELLGNDTCAPDHASAQAEFECAYPHLDPTHILDLSGARDLVRTHRDAIDTHSLLPRALLAANLLDSSPADADPADIDALAARPAYSTASPTYLARLMVAFTAFAHPTYQALRFPASVSKKAGGGMRKRVHRIVEEVGGLASTSFGSGGARFLVVVRTGGDEEQQVGHE